MAPRSEPSTAHTAVTHPLLFFWLVASMAYSHAYSQAPAEDIVNEEYCAWTWLSLLVAAVLSLRKVVKQAGLQDDRDQRRLPVYSRRARSSVFYAILLLPLTVESFSPLPDGNGHHSNRPKNTLNGIVDDWINEATRPNVEAIYGPIGQWDVSEATNFKYLFYNKGSFNGNISRWQTGKVTSMTWSKFFFVRACFFVRA